MSTEKRTWRCPECGSQVELSIFQLDPLACDACLTKRKSGVSATAQGSRVVPSAVAGHVAGIPDVLKFAAALVVGLIVGLPIGFIAGRITAPQSTQPTANTSRNLPARDDDAIHRDSHDDEPDESTRPGPGQKWVKGYTRKDGTPVKGHWAKDSSKKR